MSGSVELFLGFHVPAEYAGKLNRVSPEVLALFIQDNPVYLRQVVIDDVVYLGKFIGKNVEVDTLSLIQNHILSLLKKLVPEYPYSEDDLLLFPLSNV